MNNRNRRTGFTLVELLAVIVIIGILVALITPAVFRARLSAQKAQITAEINQLDMALSRMATESGDSFPPDFTTFNSVGSQAEMQKFFGGEMKRYMARRFPKYAGKNIDAAINSLYGADDAQHWPKQGSESFLAWKIDPAEALVFWLGGLSVPPGADSTKLRGFSANPSNPIEGRAMSKRIAGFYDFQEDRLVDRDSDGWYEYIPPGNIGAGNGPPYVYFNSKTYSSLLDSTGNPIDQNKFNRVRYPKLEAQQTSEWGFATPYRSSEGRSSWANPKKFQIISAGLDGVFGNTLATTQGPKAYPKGEDYDTADLDNLTNFAESDLEGKKP